MAMHRSTVHPAVVREDLSRVVAAAVVVIGLLAVLTAMLGFNPPWLPSMDLVPDPAGALPF
jgi:hypothetical protein